ncbi:S66 family peptidase [Paenibacillus ottowii]|uniref:LD-carboxypeptidase n=1 Tax=Paenibacillus ottowii TaxID=2315729 RepID=A0ABY3B3G8_9BACL|nr:S66 peptidase family protein [Paenibacillus ottowii]NEU28918.1 LD-carboxypeptidase [Paenibacillus polymyxa]TQR98306.1 LD-carboxypeptidase [Paenibacillus ottowii]
MIMGKQAPKLKAGDEIRILSPSRSLSIVSKENRLIALNKLEGLGFKVSFSQHVLENDDFASSSIESRVADLHEAFIDPKVKGILTSIGGYNANQLLAHLDYELISAHPKRLCGYSDITALSHAIYAKTGIITYAGPHFLTFAMLRGNDYTTTYFQRLMLGEGSIQIQSSPEWSDDTWYLDQDRRSFHRNAGPYAIHEGEAEGTIVGGNLCTLNLLQGTPYMPSLKGTILFVEDDYESSPATFDRDLQSLLHQPEFDQVKGIIIGRFQKASHMTEELLRQIISSKRELASIPVIADADFGHTTPQFTYPIGGKAIIRAYSDRVSIEICE